MNIRKKENLLFDQWKTRYPDDFVIDDAPYPEAFEQLLTRCLIILKDANIDPDDPRADFLLRAQLAETPHDWRHEATGVIRASSMQRKESSTNVSCMTVQLFREI